MEPVESFCDFDWNGYWTHEETQSLNLDPGLSNHLYNSDDFLADVTAGSVLQDGSKNVIIPKGECSQGKFSAEVQQSVYPTLSLLSDNYNRTSLGQLYSSNQIATTVVEDRRSYEESICTTLIISGLSQRTTQDSLLSLMAWSFDFIDAKLLPADHNGISGFVAAAFRFSTPSGAQIAKDLLNGKANIDASAYMVAEMSQDNVFKQTPPTEGGPRIVRRHKWQIDHLKFLESKFLSDSKPSRQAKKAFAEELGVSEKNVHTWFNNARQRLKAKERDIIRDGKSIESSLATGLSLSAERLSLLSRESSEGESPLERYRNSPQGSYNEPSSEIIAEAAWKRRYPLPSPSNSRRQQSYPASMSSAHSRNSSRSANSSHSRRCNASHKIRHEEKVKRRASGANRGKQGPLRIRLSCDCGEVVQVDVPNNEYGVKEWWCLVCERSLEVFKLEYPYYDKLEARCPAKDCIILNSKKIESLCDTLRCPCGQMVLDYSLNCEHSPTEYYCTYCSKEFASRYGWERHETTKHRPGVVWTCCSTNPVHDRLCIFCLYQNPCAEHIKYHGYNRCLGRHLDARTYGRKDQFLQHLRSFHKGSRTQEDVLAVLWETQPPGEDDPVWYCGICNERFTNWRERLKHIGKHWEDGFSMKEWKNFTTDVRNSLSMENGDKSIDDTQLMDAPKDVESNHSNKPLIRKIWSTFKNVLR